jgi:hypothetical protein
VKKFNSVLEQYLKDNVDLIKIRLRVDPKNKYGRDFRDFDGYEGYILKEGDYTSVMIEGCDLPIMSIPMSIISVIGASGPNVIESVKNRALKELKKRGKLTPEILDKVRGIESLDFLDQYLKSEGLADYDIKRILMSSIRSEAIDWNKMRERGSKLGSIAKKGLKAGIMVGGAMIAPGMVANNIAGKVQRGVQNFMSSPAGHTPSRNGDSRARALADGSRSRRIISSFTSPAGWTTDPNNNTSAFIFSRGLIDVEFHVNGRREITMLNYYNDGVLDNAKAKKILRMDPATVHEISNPPTTP